VLSVTIENAASLSLSIPCQNKKIVNFIAVLYSDLNLRGKKENLLKVCIVQSTDHEFIPARYAAMQGSTSGSNVHY
jgi:hypothetical protein